MHSRLLSSHLLILSRTPVGIGVRALSELDTARQRFEEALRLNPGDHRSRINLAMVFAQ